MRIAIVTAYYKEPLEVVRRCVDSVKAQTPRCTHILVADGHARPEIDSWDVQHIKLPVSHGDYGDTPRFVGSVSAHARGFDALCWLDADNWYEPDHVASCLELAQARGVSVVTATRILRRLDASALGVCTESNGREFNDTNCYLLMRPAMLVARAWGFKPAGHKSVGDRIVWRAVLSAFPERAHNPKPTVNYETLVAMHYLERRELPPPEAKVWIAAGDEDPKPVSYWEHVERVTRRSQAPGQ